MLLKQSMVPRAQEQPHALVQIGVVFCLTKKLSWKDRLNTVMVSLIGHHLSMMKLSKDYKPLLGRDLPVAEKLKVKGGGLPVAKKLTVNSHYVEKKSHPRILGCNNYPSIQKEKESSSLWQSLRYLFIVSCWEDPCKSILLNQLYEHLEQSGLLPESLCGFRKDRETIEMIFTARQL